MRSTTSEHMREPDEDPFYSVPEAAQILHVSQATIWRWVESGRLPAYRIGPRRIRIRKQDVDLVISPVHRKTAGKKPVVSEKRNIWAGYDPGKVREALRKSAGAFAGIDADGLIAEIHAARGQDSRGRPE